MLARLEALAGVEHAAIDYHGDLLKLALSDELARRDVITLLSELGYGAEPASESDIAERQHLDARRARGRRPRDGRSPEPACARGGIRSPTQPWRSAHRPVRYRITEDAMSRGTRLFFH